MIRRMAAAAAGSVLLGFLMLVTASPAHGACEGGATLEQAQATCPEDDTADPAGNPANTIQLVCMDGFKVGCVLIKCDLPGAAVAALYEVTDANGTRRACLAYGETFAVAVTTGDVLRAMRRLTWPASRLVIQPPDGLTLVNFDTNFYTPDTAAVTRRVTLLGQPITIEATPSEFTWGFGDGQSRTTTIPGRAYPSLDITHNYLRKGTYQVSLATTYSGRFRIGGGAWQSIPGTVTVNGATQPLRAIEAQPKLVGY